MGNCCGGGEVDERRNLTSGGRRAFQGEGHRLGTASEAQVAAHSGRSREDIENNMPEPYHDANLSEADRAKVRADRAAAAEARLKKQGGTTKKKKTSNENAPLRGPNSQPTMRWTAG